MKQLVTLACGAIVVGGLAYWVGRSSHDTAQAAPVEPARESARAESATVRTSQPPPAVRAAPPALPRRNAAPGLHADLTGPDPKVRRAAVLEVARSTDPDPAVMLAASRDSDAEVAAVAMASLGKLYAAGQVSPKDMIERASDRGINDRVRLSALNGLGTIDNPDAAKAMIQLLANGTAFERRAVAALLGGQDPDLAIPALIRALGDSDEIVRGNAHESLVLRSRGRDFGSDAGSWSAWWQSRR